MHGTALAWPVSVGTKCAERRTRARDEPAGAVCGARLLCSGLHTSEPLSLAGDTSTYNKRQRPSANSHVRRSDQTGVCRLCDSTHSGTAVRQRLPHCSAIRVPWDRCGDRSAVLNRQQDLSTIRSHDYSYSLEAVDTCHCRRRADADPPRRAATVA